MLSYLSLKIGFNQFVLLVKQPHFSVAHLSGFFVESLKRFSFFFRRSIIEESEQKFAISNYGSRPEASSIYYIGKECR